VIAARGGFIRWLSERERVGLGVALEEGDLDGSLASVVLADELVHASLAEHAVAVLVDVDAA
jgi:hypothetical protein